MAHFVRELPLKQARGATYQIAADLIENAEKEILVLWYQNPLSLKVPEEQWRSDEWNKQKSRYHQALIKKCLENKGKSFFYRRILQIPEPIKVKNGIIKHNLLSTTTFEHCYALLDFINKNPESSTAVLKYAPIFMEQVFVLIDGRHILWEVDGLNPENDSEYMDSVVVFDDLNGDFAHYLRDFFMKVDVHSSLVKQVVGLSAKSVQG